VRKLLVGLIVVWTVMHAEFKFCFVRDLEKETSISLFSYFWKLSVTKLLVGSIVVWRVMHAEFQISLVRDWKMQ
jgi:hypothetical protein